MSCGGRARWVRHGQVFLRVCGVLGRPPHFCGAHSLFLGRADEFVLRRAENINAILEVAWDLHDPQLQYLLCSCCVYLRVNYVLRACHPSWVPSSIDAFDMIIHDALSCIWNLGFYFDQRVLINLPILLDSVVQSLPLVRRILRSTIISTDRLLGSVETWNIRFWHDPF